MKESEEGVDVTVLAKRRAKLAKLRGEHFVQGRDITSAPSVTRVDEFEYNFGAANQQQSETARDIPEQGVDHKIFYAEKGRDKSDLKFNSLINEANKRRGRHITNDSPDDLSFIDDEAHNYSITSPGGVEGTNDENGALKQKNYENKSFIDNELARDIPKRNVSRGYTFTGHDYNDNKHTAEKRNSLDRERSTKTYQDGRYVLSSEDLGYQSAASSPDENKKRTASKNTERDDTFAYKKPTQLLKVEKGVDPLNMSLPENFLKTVKDDLSESIKSYSSTRSKVVYDPKMFTRQSKVNPNSSVDPEKEYFERMNKFHGNRNTSSRNFSLDQSSGKQNDHKNNHGALNKEELSALECIDLGDPVHSAVEQHRREARDIPDSPAMSERTEFEDPDEDGRSRKKKDLKNTSLSGVLLSISSIGKRCGKEKAGVHKRNTSNKDCRPLNSSLSSSSWSRGTPTPGHGEEDMCKICIHKKRTSCWTVLALLALDIFTICLIIILFNQMQSQSGGIGSHLAQTGGVPDHDHEDDPPQEPQILTKGRSLDLPIFNDSDHSHIEMEEALNELKNKFDQEMKDMKEQIQKIRSPPSFSCHKTDSHTSETKVFYSDCSVATPGMDRSTGIFHVKEAGVYQITFTGMFVSLKGHMVSADIYLRTGGKDEIIGRSSAKTDEDGVFGKDDDLHATTSIIVMERLNVGNKVFVSMVISGPHGDSKLESDFSRKIHFTGVKISD